MGGQVKNWVPSSVARYLKAGRTSLFKGGDVLNLVLCFLKAENPETLVTPNHESNFIRDAEDRDSYII